MRKRALLTPPQTAKHLFQLTRTKTRLRNARESFDVTIPPFRVRLKLPTCTDDEMVAALGQDFSARAFVNVYLPLLGSVARNTLVSLSMLDSMAKKLKELERVIVL